MHRPSAAMRKCLLWVACVGVTQPHMSAVLHAQRAVVTTSPAPLVSEHARPRLFLAGSIESGRAVDWQQDVIRQLADVDVEILNPRRADWDPAWKPELADSHFRQQVEWELNALEAADVIVMYLAPETQSPISLLELGLYARSDRLIVLCPQGFWRKGNVDAVVARYGVQTVSSLPELAEAARRKLAAVRTLVPAGDRR